jgi:hypothetical protein
MWLVVALALGTPIAIAGQGEPGSDPFEAMGVLRVVPPAPVPDLAFRALDGRLVRLRDLRGKPVVLGFFTTW